MSSVFLNDMKRKLDEDEALTQLRHRQSLQEDRSSEQEFMPIETEDKAFEREDMMMETEVFQEEPEGDMNFIFDGLLEAMRRRNLNE